MFVLLASFPDLLHPSLLPFQLVHPDRYYIRHDAVTIQSSSGVKKDRFLFLFNDLLLITSCKRRSGTLTKKSANAIIVYVCRPPSLVSSNRQI